MSTYQQQANDFLSSIGVKFSANFLKHDKHFADDKESRDIFNCTFSRNGKRFSVRFGQSIARTGEAPTAYDVLTCLTKYEPGTFDDFCGDYGYENDSRKAEKIYKAVCKEWQKVSNFFTSEELDQLQEIQ